MSAHLPVAFLAESDHSRTQSLRDLTDAVSNCAGYGPHQQNLFAAMGWKKQAQLAIGHLVVIDIKAGLGCVCGHASDPVRNGDQDRCRRCAEPVLKNGRWGWRASCSCGQGVPLPVGEPGLVDPVLAWLHDHARETGSLAAALTHIEATRVLIALQQHH